MVKKGIIGIVVYIAILVPLGLRAQADSTSMVVNGNTKHELALNFTYFIKQFLDFNSSSFAISPYGFSYKMIKPNNHTFRTGFGIGYSGSSEDFEDPTATDRKSKNFSFDYRLGYEYQIRLARKWSMFAGVDAVFKYANSSSYTSNTFQTVDISQTDFAAGAGPVLGVQVHFNDRVSLFTESSLYLVAGFNKSKNKFTSGTGGGSSEQTNHVKNSSLNFQLPTSLYLAVRLFKK